MSSDNKNHFNVLAIKFHIWKIISAKANAMGKIAENSLEVCIFDNMALY